MILTHNKKVYNELINKYMKLDNASDETKTKLKKYIAPRYITDICINIKSINKSNNFLEGRRKIKLTNISSDGIGFITSIPLNEKFFYEVSFEIFKENKIDSVIKIVRKNDLSDGNYDYGAMFCGLTDRDRNLINTYGVFHSEEKK